MTRHGRTEGDSWDLASSVGATATMVAASRAVASQGPNPLLDDPLADPLVRAVGLDPFIRIIDGEVDRRRRPADEPQDQGRADRGADKVFRRLLHQCHRRGVRQAVILASGLDTRAYRLAVAGGHGRLRDRPAAGHRRSRPARWPTSAPRRPPSAGPSASTCATTGRRRCATAGSTSRQPTAWSAEGLLPYLPPDAQDRLFDNITALSAPGSRLATEHVPDPQLLHRGLRCSSSPSGARRAGFDLDLAELFYRGRAQRRRRLPDRARLGGDGPSPSGNCTPHNGFEFPDDEMVAAFGDCGYVTATLR